jgi:serine/threonine protein kinase/tetratricopeptide (TPR) repeat protein
MSNTTSDHTTEQAIFGAARLMPKGEQREAYLRDACGDNSPLRQRLDQLLTAFDQSPDFLESPVAPWRTGAESSATEPPGATIGPYTILDVIGEGGMGVVYRAAQTEPVARQVALKIIKPGMDSRACLARFEAERLALALMDHPHIAKVLDAGTTSNGRPYFVMELVQGIPITRYCDANQLCVKERMELAIPVCQAIQHAHQKGIVHRDIKPSNVLVTTYDGHPVPKVIDFGVAKATQARRASDDSAALTLTRLGQVIGTLEYMAPEQAEVNPEDIDTRADIYSLGVLLYELLTGVTPFDKQHFRDVAFHEMLRIIREEEPARPSTKLSSLDALPSVAATRSTEPARLTRALRGELDWIVMKALEKDRNRRYDTASSLALDLQRFLQDEPVLACPPSTGYRLQKYARKHRALLTTAALVALALLAGTILSTWQAIRATHAEALAKQNEARALAEEKNARDAAAAEADQRRHAEEQTREVHRQRLLLEQNDRVNSIVTERILEALKQVPGEGAKRQALLVEVMGRLSDLEPDDRVRAFHSAGNQFVTLKEYASAKKAYAEALALNPHHAGVYVSRGDLYFRQGKFAEAAEDYTAAIQHRLPNDPANGHLPYARRGFAWCQQGDFDRALADFTASYEESGKPTLNILAQCFRGGGITNATLDERLHSGVTALIDRYVTEQGQTEESRRLAADRYGDMKLYREVRRHLEAVVQTGSTSYYPYYGLAVVNLQLGDREGYRKACAEMLARQSVLKDDDFESYTAYSFGLGPGPTDDYAPVIELARRSVAKRTTSGQRRLILGALLFRAGQYEEARQRLREAIAAQDDQHASQLYGRYFLAMTHHHLGQSEDAQRVWQQARNLGYPYYTWRFQVLLQLLARETRQLLPPPEGVSQSAAKPTPLAR